MSLPLNIPSIIGQVVANTATAMGIPIQYKHGTWQHIRERIITENGGFSSNQRFPLVCLVQVFEEKFKADSEYSEASLTLLICNNSQPEWYSEDRYTNNYLPTLYPIYAELMEQLNQTPEIVGYKTRYFEHTKVDDLHLPENNANKLPECLDGLWIQDLKLTFDVPPCRVDVSNVCSQTPCPNGAMLDYFFGVRGVTYTHVNSKNLLIQADTSGVGSVVVTIPPNGGNLTGFNLFVGNVANGDYVGTINFFNPDNSKNGFVEFYYSVKNGDFEHYPKTFGIFGTYNFNCYNFIQNGGYRFSYTYTSNYHNINSVNLMFASQQGVISNTSFAPVKFVSQQGTALLTNLQEFTFVFTLTLENGITLQNKFFIKLKCQ